MSSPSAKAEKAREARSSGHESVPGDVVVDSEGTGNRGRDSRVIHGTSGSGQAAHGPAWETWGGWGPNPRPKDYESSALTD